VLWLPYAAFHFVAQEPWTMRYALPLVVPVAYLAARGIMALPHRARMAVATIAVVATAGSSVRALAADASARSPLFDLVEDMTRAAARETQSPIVLSHFNTGVALARAEELMNRRVGWRQMPAPVRREWLQIAEVWQSAPASRVWFVAHPRRTDLALIDPSSLRLLGTYRHPDAVRSLVAGSRPSGLDWYEISRPNWIALEGWALTPETAGIATRDRRGPDAQPITALVRPLAEAAAVVIGGRHLGASDAGPARITVRVDGRTVRSFVVQASPRDFLELFTLPPAVQSNNYVALTIAALGANGAPAPVAIEQFEYQPVSAAVFGFGRGWHERELDERRALMWRWTAARADLHIAALGDVRVQIAGESPERYFDGPARLTLHAGNALVAQRTVDADYGEVFCVRRDVL
jgi:hypothetical protein